MIFQSSVATLSSRALLEMFSDIVFSFTRGVTRHYNPDEPEFTLELFGCNPFESTGREWNSFPVDEMIYQEYRDRQDTTLDYLLASGLSTIERRMFAKCKPRNARKSATC